MKKVPVALDERSYEIIIGRAMYSQMPDILNKVISPGKALLISDSNVFPLYGQKTLDGLYAAGFDATFIVIEPGEGSKTLAQAEKLYTVAIEKRLDRHSLVVALGGGVVGDLAGFVAATYLRGIRFIQIPTTLLAQVDSGVGGKVAVNHSLGKNLIGAFYQPRLVWVELETLLTLPPREYQAGLAEVVKYGAVLDESFFGYLEEHQTCLAARELSVLSEVVSACCRLKANVVTRDERETDYRAVLNFGHTFGHALEAVTGYQYYLHGEAVLVGMILASWTAQKLGKLQYDDIRRLWKMFASVGIKPPPSVTAQAVLEAMEKDKKRETGKLVLIIPTGIGAFERISLDHTDLVSVAVDWYLSGAMEKELDLLAD
jgi:3-dehydroquinate synthase